MCGISGFNWPDKEMIGVMNDTLRHRGPDGEGSYVNGHVSLGHRRLAIIDLSERGKQPMCNEDERIWLVYNGEVYNFKELREELEQKGHRFTSGTDAEVIIHAYEEWDIQCLSRFNGMFAFTIYDSDKKILFLARDRFGIKPLYYYAENHKFIFSSEIKGILCHPIPRKPDDRVIFEYLRYNLLQHRPETFLEDIYQVPPGHYLTYDCTSQTLSIKEWYRLICRSDYTVEEERVADVKNMFTDSVRLRMVADVPVGSCLSGGLDSSSIVCAMRQFLPEGDIRTFSSVFPGYQMDESTYINEVVDFAKLDSFSVSPSEENLMNDLEDLVRTQEEPFTGLSVYAQYRVMKLAGENGMKVLLDGQGGDELFGGYTYYFGFYFYELFHRLRGYRLLKEMLLYLKYFRNILPFQAFLFLLLPERIKYRLWGTRVNWISRELYKRFAGDKVLDPRWSVKSLNEGLLVTLSRSAIPHLLNWEDKNSMRWSVESRVPFLDYRLVEMVATLPPGDKLKDGLTKHIFREAVDGSIPVKVSQRRDKIGFSVPEDKWLSHPKVVEFTRDLIESASFRERKYWDYRQVKEQAKHYFSGRKSRGLKADDVWKWINLELWLRYFID